MPAYPQVTDLCKCTGAEGGKKPANYPESYFARFKVPSTMVHMVIDRLRSDDVYNLVRAGATATARGRGRLHSPPPPPSPPRAQTQTYPSPEHRTAALSQQASVLVVLLFFAPDVLQRERATMREVVDKHFSDNWVCTIYMGWVRSASTNPHPCLHPHALTHTHSLTLTHSPLPVRWCTWTSCGRRTGPPARR